MIRLTLNTPTNTTVHSFDKPQILMGSDPHLVDLILPGPEIQPVHLKIQEKNGSYFLFNETNDPFVSLNHLPFGKKLLKSGDIISAHELKIFFEQILPLQKDEEDETEIITGKPDNLSQFSTLPSFALPFEQEEIDSLKGDEIEKEALDAYISQLQTPNQNPQKPEAAMEIGANKKKKKNGSLKDEYLKELEEDSHTQTYGAKSSQPKDTTFYQNWKWIFLFVFSILIMALMAGTILYHSFNGKTEVQESIAAQGMADIAMALTYAQLNHAIPQNQNYSDVEFLKGNLQAILPETPSYGSQINSQGHFNCCSYTLRIYTSSDLSHFILIAQPSPNLYYWLIPQAMIVVDSNLMELRTLKEVKNLNRLLANPDPLDGVNGKEITDLIKKGNLIPLESLNQGARNADFIAPKNFSWILPGADNLIYNAPRYYRLCQQISQQALNLAKEKGSSQDVSALKQSIERLSALKHLILYSDQGKKSAATIRQTINLFAPSDHLLFGYIHFNAQGKIHQAHLLEELEEKEIAATEPQSDLITHSLDEIKKEQVLQPKIVDDLIDRNHPIYIQLQVLMTAREHELKPLISALNTLVLQELANPRTKFQIEYQNLSHTYLMANDRHKKAIKEKLDSLYSQYDNIPIHQFLAYIHDLHIDQLIQEEGGNLTIVDENCQQNMEALLTHMENSKSLPELNNIVHIAASWLNFDYIKDPKELIRYQNLIRNQLLEQLEGCILTLKTNLIVKEEDREVLKDILNQERLIKPDEKDFFLEEFEELVRAEPPAPQL